MFLQKEVVCMILFHQLHHFWITFLQTEYSPTILLTIITSAVIIMQPSFQISAIQPNPRPCFITFYPTGLYWLRLSMAFLQINSALRERMMQYVHIVFSQTSMVQISDIVPQRTKRGNRVFLFHSSLVKMFSDR